MNKEQRQQVYRNALATWGAESQEWMLIEEMGEVMQALNKVRRADTARQHIPIYRTMLLGELADLAIMLEQVVLLYGGDLEELKEMKEARLIRLHALLHGGTDE